MAHTITFDQLAFVKTLEKAGFEADKSEAIACVIAIVFEADLKDTFFTKHDGE